MTTAPYEYAGTSSVTQQGVPVALKQVWWRVYLTQEKWGPHEPQGASGRMVYRRRENKPGVFLVERRGGKDRPGQWLKVYEGPLYIEMPLDDVRYASVTRPQTQDKVLDKNTWFATAQEAVAAAPVLWKGFSYFMLIRCTRLSDGTATLDVANRREVGSVLKSTPEALQWECVVRVRLHDPQAFGFPALPALPAPAPAKVAPTPPEPNPPPRMDAGERAALDDAARQARTPVTVKVDQPPELDPLSAFGASLRAGLQGGPIADVQNLMREIDTPLSEAAQAAADAPEEPLMNAAAKPEPTPPTLAPLPTVENFTATMQILKLLVDNDIPDVSISKHPTAGYALVWGEQELVVGPRRK